MKKTIIASIVAVLCTAAICITYAVKTPSQAQTSAASQNKAYMTEAEAAEYIGVNEDVIVMLRRDLKQLEGSYVSYYYTDANGDEVNSIVYNKDALDEVMEKIMDDANGNTYNFKYLQQVNDESK